MPKRQPETLAERQKRVRRITRQINEFLAEERRKRQDRVRKPD